MGLFDLMSDKDVKRSRLKANKDRGRFAEGWFEMTSFARGTKVKRKPHGQDYIEYNSDVLGNTRGKGTHVEIKTGRAKLSKLQKKTQKKHKGNYKVLRTNDFW